MKTPLRIAVTGSTGNVAYPLLFRIASGEVFGADQPVVLHLIDIEPALKALEGVVMELDDCAFPLLDDIVVTSDYKAGFDGVSWALLVGSMPRKQGMERGDLLKLNGEIFKPVGEALNAVAATDVRVLVVGNPCNTNCLIARANARDIPDDRWFAMVRLDANRAMAQLAKKAGVPVGEVANLAIWGNHSNTQFPDAANARIGGKPATEVITDTAWLQGDFIRTVQQRGAAIIEARGASSAASAANAAIDSVTSVLNATAPADCAALAVVSHGEYDIPEGLVFGYPVRTDATTWNVAEDFVLDDFAKDRIRATTEELLGERQEVKDLLPS